LFFFEEKDDGANAGANFGDLKGGHLIDDALL
jgi:hypothetical protein